MSTGYEQALSNVIYSINHMATQLDNSEGDLANKILGILTKDSRYAEITESARKLDQIISVIATTYNKTEDEVDADIDRMFSAHLAELITGGG